MSIQDLDNLSESESQIIISSVLLSIKSNEDKIKELKVQVSESKSLLQKLGYSDPSKSISPRYSWRNYILNILELSDRALSRSEIFNRFKEVYPDIYNQVGEKKSKSSLSGSYSKMVRGNALDYLFRFQEDEKYYGIFEWFESEQMEVFIVTHLSEKLRCDYDDIITPQFRLDNPEMFD